MSHKDLFTTLTALVAAAETAVAGGMPDKGVIISREAWNALRDAIETLHALERV